MEAATTAFAADMVARRIGIAILNPFPLMNGSIMVPRAATDLRMAMVATGFGYDAEIRVAQGAIVAGLIDRVRDIRLSRDRDPHALE